MHTRNLLLAVLLAAPCLPALAGGRVEVQVRANVLATVKMRHADSVRTVQLPADARGDVVVPHAASFEVFCNTGGFAVDFEVTDPAVEEVTVQGLEAPVRVSASGASAAVRMSPDARIARRTLHYRVRYAAGTPPGPRPAPLMLAVRADL